MMIGPHDTAAQNIRSLLEYEDELKIYAGYTNYHMKKIELSTKSGWYVLLFTSYDDDRVWKDVKKENDVARQKKIVMEYLYSLLIEQMVDEL